MNKLYCFIGASASGKSTAEEKFIQKGMSRLVSDTTRAIRENEIDTVHYNFISVEEFNKRDYANVITITDTWLYGVSENELQRLSELKSDSIYSVINIEPAINILNFVKRKNIKLDVKLIFFDIDQEFRKNLLIKRGETAEAIEKRFSREEKLSDFEKFNFFPDFVVTDFYFSFEKISEWMQWLKLKKL